MLATIALAAIAGNPAGGVLTDRWTPRRAVMAGLVVAAAGSAALAGAGAIGLGRRLPAAANQVTPPAEPRPGQDHALPDPVSVP